MGQIVASLKELDSVVRYLNSTIPENAIIFLIGDLASGKTTLTKSIAKSRGIDREVRSPTFSLQHRYGKSFFHYDLYRIEYDEFMQLGLFEEFDREGWHLVEWGGDKLREFLKSVGYKIYTVRITPHNEKRKYIIGEG